MELSDKVRIICRIGQQSALIATALMHNENNNLK